MKKKEIYIDIFSGCGGLSLGLFNAGWTGCFAIEKNEDAFNTLRHNLIDQKKHFAWPKWLPIAAHDINELIKKYSHELNDISGTITLVAGGPPCQGFSMAGKRNRDDMRNKLVKSYIKFIRIVKPKAIVFENVHGFTVDFKNEVRSVKFSQYVQNALKRLGYKVCHEIIDMSNFGIPQKRKRYIMVGLLDKDPISVFSKLVSNLDMFLNERGLSNPIGTLAAINDLRQSIGEVDSPDTYRFKAGIYGEIESPYQKLMRNDIINLECKAVDSHRFVNHRGVTIKLHNDLLEKATRGKRIAPCDNVVEGLKRRGVTVLDANMPAPTITSIPDDMIHYEEPRILTVREHARLQSFPDWYEIKGVYTTGGERRKYEVPRYTQIGNAIPPLFAEQLGIALKEVLFDES